MSTHSGTQAKKTNVVYISFDDGKEMIRSLYGDLAIKEGCKFIAFDGTSVYYTLGITFKIPPMLHEEPLLEFFSLIRESRAPLLYLTELVKRPDGSAYFCHKLFNYNPGVSYNPMVESCAVPAKGISSADIIQIGNQSPAAGEIST